MLITRVSMITGLTHTMDLAITTEQIMAYNSGVLLQDAFPNLTNEQREFFKTGITPEEWNSVFPDDEED